jgi:hypothetical protein
MGKDPLVLSKYAREKPTTNAPEKQYSVAHLIIEAPAASGIMERLCIFSRFADGS